MIIYSYIKFLMNHTLGVREGVPSVNIIFERLKNKLNPTKKIGSSKIYKLDVHIDFVLFLVIPPPTGRHMFMAPNINIFPVLYLYTNHMFTYFI